MVFPTVGWLCACGIELGSVVVDDVLRLLARSPGRGVDGIGDFYGRWRRLEEREADDAPGEMIENDADPVAERPDLRQATR